ncbi:MAG: aminotransferase class V-fold PLP-dependent enzyme, partial [Oscillospiraceae bacterium]
MLVYADNAATTKMSETAKNAMLPIFDEVYGNPSSLHTVGQIAKAKLEEARTKMAEL